jgi:cytochrome c oxidase accessory protein FixG
MSPSPRVHLPIAQSSSLRADGTRIWVYPADVRGRFMRARRIVFAMLIIFWAAIPFIEMGGHPLMQLDVERRRFFILGLTYGAQDAWLLLFALTGLGLALVVTTSLWGRVWCGWACPQTVFLEGFFRPIERLIEGPREKQIKLDKAPWTLDKIARKSVKHAIFVLLAMLVAHVFVGYFVTPWKLWAMIGQGPSAHPEAFAWATGLTLIFYGNFAKFREQTCVGVCPYGRLQSVLVDQDTTVVGYDQPRGEPRGKKGTTTGDCVDCNRCVVVCPTGIDIRNGLQPDCIGCAQCADACDVIMGKLERPLGLIRHDSMRALTGGGRAKLLRPRVYVYAAIAFVWLVGFVVAVRGRTPFEAGIARVGATPFIIEGGTVRNAFTIHLVNKQNEPTALDITARGDRVTFMIPIAHATLEPFGTSTIPVVATVPRSATARPVPITIEVKSTDGTTKQVTAVVLGPGGGT